MCRAEWVPVRDVTREAHERIFEGKPPLSCFIYSSRTAVLLKSSALKERAEVRAERTDDARTCHVFSFVRFLRSCCCLYCSTKENPLSNDAIRIDDEIVNKTLFIYLSYFNVYALHFFPQITIHYISSSHWGRNIYIYILFYVYFFSPQGENLYKNLNCNNL